MTRMIGFGKGLGGVFLLDSELDPLNVILNEAFD